jgi:hypothetical protein
MTCHINFKHDAGDPKGSPQRMRSIAHANQGGGGFDRLAETPWKERGLLKD